MLSPIMLQLLNLKSETVAYFVSFIKLVPGQLKLVIAADDTLTEKLLVLSVAYSLVDLYADGYRY